MKFAIYAVAICVLAPFISAMPTGQPASSHVQLKRDPPAAKKAAPATKGTSASASTCDPNKRGKKLKSPQSLKLPIGKGKGVGRRAVENLFVVWYKPVGIAPRHWALFLTASATIPTAPQDVAGTLYHIVGDGGITSNPENVAARMPSPQYAGSAHLGQIDNARLASYFKAYAQQLIELLEGAQNCHNWTKDFVNVLVDGEQLPANANQVMTTVPTH